MTARIPADDAGGVMPERSILARLFAYGLYGWTDEEFCDEEEPDSEFDRVTFLQLADIALAHTRAEADRLRATLGAVRSALLQGGQTAAIRCNEAITILAADSVSLADVRRDVLNEAADAWELDPPDMLNYPHSGGPAWLRARADEGNPR